MRSFDAVLEGPRQRRGPLRCGGVSERAIQAHPAPRARTTNDIPALHTISISVDISTPYPVSVEVHGGRS
jgi:hypothetical protein